MLSLVHISLWVSHTTGSTLFILEVCRRVKWAGDNGVDWYYIDPGKP